MHAILKRIRNFVELTPDCPYCGASTNRVADGYYRCADADCQMEYRPDLLEHYPE